MIAKGRTMEEPRQVRNELQSMPYEPLLPIEKKLIGWSLGLGVVLLFILIFISRTYFPA
jgi:hypothetical protein